jgi:predicted nucleic acid-binding Zn ribbon protein
MEIVTGILGAFFGGLAQLLGMNQQRQAQFANDAEKEALRQEVERQRQLLQKMQEETKKQQMVMFGAVGIAIFIVIVMMIVRR